MKDVMFWVNCFMAVLACIFWIAGTVHLLTETTTKDDAQYTLFCFVLFVVFTLSAIALAQ